LHRRRLVIDATPMLGWGARPAYSGIGRSTEEMIRALGAARANLPCDITLFGQRLRGKKLRDYGFAFPCRQLFLPKTPIIEAMKRRLPIIETFCPFDLFHATANHASIYRADKVVVTVHDAMHYAYPEEHLGQAKVADRCAAFARRCRAVVTPSQCSKDDIVKHFGVAPEKAHVLPWGVDRKRFYPVSDMAAARGRLAGRYGVHRPFFVMVSCDIGRKNSPLLVEAYLEALRAGCRHDLALVWKNPPQAVMDQVATAGAAERVHFVSGLDDDDLRLFYGAATASFFPSVYEGFGLPVLESMACGTPVVTTRCASLPEVGGEAAVYVPPNDGKSLVAMMQAFDQGRIGGEELRAKSLAQAGKFTWERYVQRLIPLYSMWLGIERRSV